jgi:hypothetical protein
MNATKTKFYFKSRKEKDAEGNVVMVPEVDKDNKPTGKQVEKVIPAADPVELEIPLMGADDLVAILQSGDEKQLKLILEGVNNVILEQARSLVNDDVEAARTKGIDYTQISWEFIANMPPATRKGAAIPDEVWEAFMKDYVEVMTHHGKTKEKAETGAKLLSKRFQPVKTNKKVVDALKGNLSLWFANTENKEQFQEVYETLATKADQLLEADEEAILASV